MVAVPVRPTLSWESSRLVDAAHQAAVRPGTPLPEGVTFVPTVAVDGRLHPLWCVLVVGAPSLLVAGHVARLWPVQLDDVSELAFELAMLVALVIALVHRLRTQTRFGATFWPDRLLLHRAGKVLTIPREAASCCLVTEAGGLVVDGTNRAGQPERLLVGVFGGHADELRTALARWAGEPGA